MSDVEETKAKPTPDPAREAKAAAKRARKAAKRAEDTRKTEEGRRLGTVVVVVQEGVQYIAKRGKGLPFMEARAYWDLAGMSPIDGWYIQPLPAWRERLIYRRSLPMVGREWWRSLGQRLRVVRQGNRNALP